MTWDKWRSGYCRVRGGELIIGKADMNRIGITTPEAALADVVRAAAASSAAETPPTE